MAGGFAVNGNGFTQRQFGDAQCPGDKAFRHFSGPDAGNHPRYAVMRGDAIFQPDPFFQPTLFFFTKLFNGFPAFSPTDDRTNGQNDDVGQLMSFMTVYTRVFQRGKGFL